MANAKHSLEKRQKKSLNLFPKIQFLLGLILILIGGGLLVFMALEKVSWVTKAPAEEITKSPDETLAKPTKIYIPKLSRVLYISDGYVRDNRWAISETGVSYLTTSALPGENGNSVIYGHNTKDKLGGLWRVGDGDHIYIVLANGNFVKYQVFETKEIKPTEVEILQQTAEKRLTIYTCSGFLDKARFVVVAQKV